MTIKDYCKQGNKNSNSFSKAMEMAENMLNESEILMYASIGFESNTPGVIVVTSKRIYFCGKIANIKGTKELYFKDIQSVQTMTDKIMGVSYGGLEIKSGIEIFKISATNGNVINNIKKAIDNVRMENFTPIVINEINTSNNESEEKKKGHSKLLIAIIIVLVMTLVIIIGMNNEKTNTNINNTEETTNINN